MLKGRDTSCSPHVAVGHQDLVMLLLVFQVRFGLSRHPFSLSLP